MRRSLLTALFGGYVLVLLDLTLLRFPQPGAFPNFVPFGTIGHYLHIGGREMWLNVVGNLAAFVPLGLLLPMFRDEWRSLPCAGAFSLAVSLLIESLQYISGQRVADVDDLLLNTLGGILGYLAFAVLRRVFSAPALSQPAG